MANNFRMRNSMPKAILKDGAILPLEPLPTDWQEGEELRIDKDQATSDGEKSSEDIERAFEELSLLCAANDPEDDDRFQRALDEMKKGSKGKVCRPNGLGATESEISDRKPDG
jgi:hypothetical protein